MLDGAVLPTDPAECLQRVEALALEAEAQRRALEARLLLLEEVRVSVPYAVPGPCPECAKHAAEAVAEASAELSRPAHLRSVEADDA